MENTLFRVLQEQKEQDEDGLLIILGLVNLMGLIDIINGRSEKKAGEKAELPRTETKNSSAEALLGLLSQMAQKPNRIGKSRSGLNEKK